VGKLPYCFEMAGANQHFPTNLCHAGVGGGGKIVWYGMVSDRRLLKMPVLYA
jgi:hypothetical protein